MQPLQPFRQPEMDHSFVGMKGGEIFHEMMLRHGVKHICTCIHDCARDSQVSSNIIRQSATLAVPFSPCSTPSITALNSISFCHDMSKVLATWPRAMREPPANVVWCS